MASYCPKCNYKLKLTDLKPQCPKCNTNLLYYRIEERLEVDAVNAELEHAHTQKKLDRAKASYSGSPLAFVRDAFWLLALLAFLLPLCKLSAAGPYFDSSQTFTAIEVVQKVMEMDFGVLGLMRDSSLLGQTAILFTAALGCLTLALLTALFQLVFSFLSCSPKGFVRNVIFSALGIVFSVGSIVTFRMFIGSMDEILPGFMQGSVGFGIYIVAAMFALVLIINIIIQVRGGIPVKYKQCYVGKDNTKYEDFVAKYGDKPVTLNTILDHYDDFMKRKENNEPAADETQAESNT